MKHKNELATVTAAIVAVCGLIWFVGSENPQVPAGYVGYVTRGAIFGQTQFHSLVTGPGSPGRGWLLDAVNISVTPYTYTEEFVNTKRTAVLSKDNLAMEFNAHLVWRVRSNMVREAVERYSTLTKRGDGVDGVEQVAYNNFVREPLRTYARDEVQRREGLAIKTQIQEIGQAMTDRLRVLTEETPFEVVSVVVGNIQYPQIVAEAVAAKLATTQVLERKQTEIEIEKAEREKRIVQAEGIAAAMERIQMKLTPLYVQHEAIEAQKAMVGSPNHSTIYIPVGPMGVPLVRTVP